MALPYIDHGYDDPGVRESALAMVEEECRRYRPTKNYLDHLPSVSNAFETKLMQTEFERIQQRLPMEQLSMKRYELPPPSAGKLSELSAWQESIENSYAQLEHQSVRAINLDLMLEYGCETWKAFLEVFTAMQAKAQNRLQELKKEIQDINWQRKQAQTAAGDKLKSLEAQWVMLVSKNYEIEQECVKLENHIQELNKMIEENTNTNNKNLSKDIDYRHKDIDYRQQNDDIDYRQQEEVQDEDQDYRQYDMDDNDIYEKSVSDQ